MMSLVCEAKSLSVHNPGSKISLKAPEGKWSRHLCIDDKEAYLIGGSCDTCEFVFERMDGANKKISPSNMGELFRGGLDRVSEDVLETCSSIMPSGTYITLLQSITPALVKLGSPNDYFCNEQVDVWGIDGFWGLPHHPKVEYYRSLTKQLSEHEYFFEFIVPMVPNNWLEEDTVKQYETAIRSHIRPTALGLSILDVRQPWDSQTVHWCLTHYVLDGHHKTFAASKIPGEITLLSFLNTDHSIATQEDIERVIQILQTE
jgi:hypothetical protein